MYLNHQFYLKCNNFHFTVTKYQRPWTYFRSQMYCRLRIPNFWGSYPADPYRIVPLETGISPRAAPAIAIVQRSPCANRYAVNQLMPVLIIGRRASNDENTATGALPRKRGKDRVGKPVRRPASNLTETLYGGQRNIAVLTFINILNDRGGLIYVEPIDEQWRSMRHVSHNS